MKTDIAFIRTTLHKCQGSLMAVLEVAPRSIVAKDTLSDVEEAIRRLDTMSANETIPPLGQEPWRVSLPVITVQMLGDYGQEGFFEKTDKPVQGVKGVSWSQAAVDFACLLQGRLQELLSAEYCRGRDDHARAAEVQRNATGFPVEPTAPREPTAFEDYVDSLPENGFPLPTTDR